MKRRILVGMTILLLTILAFAPKLNQEEPDTGLYWIRTDSHFVGYTIDDTQIRFGYSFSFQNLSEQDIIISSFTATFSARELKNWIEYKKYYFGCDDNDACDVYLPAGETTSIVLFFEGQYLGGDVNEKLSPPVDIAFVQRTVGNNSESETVR